MRYLGIFLIISIFGIVFGDEIVKKDGSVFKGKIIEQAPGEYYKIELKDGSIFVVKQEDVETVRYGEAEKELLLPRKNPCLSCCLSLLIPGIGQFYNEEYRKGVFFLAGGVAFGLIAFLDYPEYENDKRVSGGGVVWYIGTTGAAIVSLWSAIDAYTTAQKMNLNRGYGALFNLEKGQLALGIPMVRINDNRKGNHQLSVVNIRF